jgi:hypothetical protein
MITCHPRHRTCGDPAVPPGRRFAWCHWAVSGSGLEGWFRCRSRREGVNRRTGTHGTAALGGGPRERAAGRTPEASSSGFRLPRCRLGRGLLLAYRRLTPIGSRRCAAGRDGTSPSRHPHGARILRRVPGPVRVWVAAAVVAAGVIFDPQAAFAASGPQFLAADSISTVISNMTAWLVGILAVVATFFLTLGGLRYLAAGGDPGEVEKAKAALRNAGIGYGLAVLAPVVVTVLKSLVGG